MTVQGIISAQEMDKRYAARVTRLATLVAHRVLQEEQGIYEPPFGQTFHDQVRLLVEQGRQERHHLAATAAIQSPVDTHTSLDPVLCKQSQDQERARQERHRQRLASISPLENSRKVTLSA